jgi:NIMA-interacting peptidyl-prolyl cis-trans isomerase 1
MVELVHNSDAAAKLLNADVVAAVAQAVLAEQQQQALPPPVVLPYGWVTKASHSQPGCYYYYNYETGMSTWQMPVVSRLDEQREDDGDERTDSHEASTANTTAVDDATILATSSVEETSNNNAAIETVSLSDSAPPVSHKRPAPSQHDDDNMSSSHKRPHTHTTTDNNNNKKTVPKQVRVLHILKKHKDSRKPTSWRAPVITQSLPEARAQLQELLTLLLEVQHHPEELRATFEELARTESDCSSAKRGGDLGFFGRKKMQKPFEDATFALQPNEMSKIVATESGLHLIFRIA